MPAPKTAFEKWSDGIDKAVGDSKWNAWDCEIQMVVNEYNRHLTHTASYVNLDWLLIKAMLWTESGAAHSEWLTKPMQIGVAGDPGLTSFLSSKEGGALILPTAWLGKLTTASVRTIPSHNIRAGVGYLLMRMANFDHKTIVASDATIHDVVVKLGDSLAKIAKAEGSTIQHLTKLNPTAHVIHPGQKLKVQRASVQQVITGWRKISTTSIADRYNGGGDPNYAAKLDYALNLIRKGKAVVCGK
jgi:hypothetical protein